jgi:hypothetical protein
VERSEDVLRDVRYPRLTRFLLERPPNEDGIALSLLTVQNLFDEPIVGRASTLVVGNDPAVPHTRSWLAAGWEVDDMNPGWGVAFVRISV